MLDSEKKHPKITKITMVNPIIFRLLLNIVYFTDTQIFADYADMQLLHIGEICLYQRIRDKLSQIASQFYMN